MDRLLEQNRLSLESFIAAVLLDWPEISQQGEIKKKSNFSISQETHRIWI